MWQGPELYACWGGGVSEESRGTGFPGAEVIGSCPPPDVGQGSQTLLLTTEPCHLTLDPFFLFEVHGIDAVSC